MIVPVFVLRARTLGVEHAERTAEIPQRPAGMQTAEHLERVAEPGMNDLGRGVLVAAHLAKMNRHACRGQFAPRLKRTCKSIAITHYYALTVFQGPGGQWFGAGE